MPSILRAKVRRELLQWAREQCNLTVEAAANKIGVSPEALGSWEAGTAQPTIKQLRRAAHVYRFSLAVFFLAAPPASTFQPIRDFRHLPGAGLRGVSPELHMAIRDAQDKRDSALELLSALEESPTAFEFRSSANDDSEATGLRLRDYLEVTDEEQSRWRGPQRAFAAIRMKLETKGVLVFQATRIPLEEMRGFAVHADELPVVVVNRADSAAGRLFSVIHETTHLSLGGSGLCNVAEREPTHAGGIEAFCNHTAGAFLVPREALLAHPLVRSRTSAWTLPELDRLVARFGASRFVIVRRLFALRQINRPVFERLTEQLEEAFARTPRRTGYLSPAMNVVSLSGNVLPSLVLQAFGAEKISASTVASYLDVKLKHLPDIRSALDRTI